MIFKLFIIFIFQISSLHTSQINFDYSEIPDSIFIGDKINLIITLEDSLYDSITVGEIEIDNSRLSLSYERLLNNKINLNFQFWEEGSYTFQGINLILYNNFGDSITHRTNYIDFFILPPFIIDNFKIRDSKGNRNIKFPFTLKKFILLSIIFFLIIVLFFVFNKNNNLVTKSNDKYFASYYEITIEQLNKLKYPDSLNSNNIEQFYLELTDILKFYLNQKFFINTIRMTTDDIIKYLKNNNYDYKSIEKLLMEADLCKFANKKIGVTSLHKAKKDVKFLIEFYQKKY